jgi:hypothetical protein
MQGPVVERIKHELLSWPGVTLQPHGFGGVDFRVGTKEIGHLHGKNMVDLPLSPSVAEAALALSGDKLIDTQKEKKKIERALPSHDVYPECKWVNYWIKDNNDVDEVMLLFRLQYNEITKGKK